MRAPLKTVAVLVGGLIGGYVGGGFLDAEPVYVIDTTPVPPAVRPGDTLRVRYVLRRERSCASKIDRILFDGDHNRYDLPDAEYSAAPGPVSDKPQSFYVRIIIPLDAAPGEAKYVAIASYTCGLVRRLWPVVETTETPFIILPPV